MIPLLTIEKARYKDTERILLRSDEIDVRRILLVALSNLQRKNKNQGKRRHSIVEFPALLSEV